MTSKLTRTPQAWRGDHSGPSPARGGKRTLCSAETAAVAESGAAPSGRSSAPPGKKTPAKSVVCSAPSLRGAGFALVRRSCSHVKTDVGPLPPVQVDSCGTHRWAFDYQRYIDYRSSVFPSGLGRSYHCPVHELSKPPSGTPSLRESSRRQTPICGTLSKSAFAAMVTSPPHVSRVGAPPTLRCKGRPQLQGKATRAEVRTGPATRAAQ